MGNWRNIVDRVIKTSDILLMVIDARDTWNSRNRDFEWKISTLGKKYLYVINKCDLLTPQTQVKTDPKILKISAEKYLNLEELKKEIWKGLDLINVYLIKKNEEPSNLNPLIVKRGLSLKNTKKAGNMTSTRKKSEIRAMLLKIFFSF